MVFSLNISCLKETGGASSENHTRQKKDWPKSSIVLFSTVHWFSSVLNTLDGRNNQPMGFVYNTKNIVKLIDRYTYRRLSLNLFAIREFRYLCIGLTVTYFCPGILHLLVFPYVIDTIIYIRRNLIFFQLAQVRKHKLRIAE